MGGRFHLLHPYFTCGRGNQTTPVLRALFLPQSSRLNLCLHVRDEQTYSSDCATLHSDFKTLGLECKKRKYNRLGSTTSRPTGREAFCAKAFGLLDWKIMSCSSMCFKIRVIFQDIITKNFNEEEDPWRLSVMNHGVSCVHVNPKITQVM